MVEWLVKHLLLVDGSPTLSRFFTFLEKTDAMLLMALLRMPPQAFTLRSVNPREENQKRLNNVHEFFRHGDAYQLLARVCLSFQLTGGVEALVSRVPAEECDASRPPPVIRLLKGEADTVVKSRLRSIIRHIAASADPALDVGAATGVALATAMELTVRLKRFRGYPAALCKMSKTYFWHESMSNCHAFLNMNPDELDVGTGLQVFKLARRDRTELKAAIWLQSRPLQELFDRLAEMLLANSLSVERKHADCKQWEGSVLSHLGSASRDAIATRYLKWRTVMVDALALHAKALRKTIRTNRQATAWQQPTAVRPVGRRWSRTRQPSLEAIVPDAASSSEPQAGIIEPQAAAASSDVVREDKAVAVARMQSALDQMLEGFNVPVTREQWDVWLTDNLAAFRETMSTVTADRRKRSIRVFARDGLPQAVARIQPQATHVERKSEWARNLQYRTGWHLLRTKGNGVIVLFLMHLSWVTHYVIIPVSCVDPLQCLLV